MHSRGDVRHFLLKILMATASKQRNGASVMSMSAAGASSDSAWQSSTHVSNEIQTTAANRLTTRIGAVLFLLGWSSW